jgi:hypothetical protein
MRGSSKREGSKASAILDRGSDLMEVKRCSRCIVPSTYTGVKFDENGVCSVCKQWDSLWKEYDFTHGKERFLKNFGKKEGKYDCIVPFSGGKDSSYVLYYVKRKLGLSPLAVNLNNYFQTDIIKENIDLVIKKLGVDMINYWPDFDNWCELMRRSFMKCTFPCLPCDVGIYALAYRSALETNTGVVVFPGGKLGAPKRPDQGPIMYEALKTFANHFDKKGEAIDISNFAVTPQMAEKVNVIYFGNYYDWREEDVLKTVVKELGWKKKGQQHARIDCALEPVINYVYSKRAKMSKQCSRLSAMVRDRQISRDEALARDRAYMINRMPREFRDVIGGINLPLSYIKRQVEGKDLMKPLWYH